MPPWWIQKSPQTASGNRSWAFFQDKNSRNSEVFMFDLPHVASRLYGTPLLVARPKLEVILQALGPRLKGEPMAETSTAPKARGQLRITEAGSGRPTP